MEDQQKQLQAELRQLEARLADSSIFATSEGQKLAKRQAEVQETLQLFERYANLQKQLNETEELQDDSELAELAQTELPQLRKQFESAKLELDEALTPKDPNDDKSAIVEIRAGAGGDEASLFAGELYRMYVHYGESQSWKAELINENANPSGGFKEIVFAVSGAGAYGQLKFESGVHRVQRIPATESSGRIHTSTATVAVLPEAEEADIEVNPSDLRIDVFRSSGPGGQSVNTTDSAVRITYLPTGLIVTCQDEKSQHKNKAKAMSVLRSRLLAQRLEEEQKQQSAERRSQIGTGDRSEKIRTYNFPQDRLTDHRINLTLHNLPGILQGNIAELITRLQAASKSAAE